RPLLFRRLVCPFVPERRHVPLVPVLGRSLRSALGPRQVGQPRQPGLVGGGPGSLHRPRQRDGAAAGAHVLADQRRRWPERGRRSNGVFVFAIENVGRETRTGVGAATHNTTSIGANDGEPVAAIEPPGGFEGRAITSRAHGERRAYLPSDVGRRHANVSSGVDGIAWHGQARVFWPASRRRGRRWK